jgi:hypothetical protein
VCFFLPYPTLLLLLSPFLCLDPASQRQQTLFPEATFVQERRDSPQQGTPRSSRVAHDGDQHKLRVAPFQADVSATGLKISDMCVQHQQHSFQFIPSEIVCSHNTDLRCSESAMQGRM